ncbi:barstar family protein [Nocardioides daphniae]|uniref:Barstar (barnase inhibitor) domain-containing protein n=1 Tax=Nocardioides daphniae TaxID=402297 RepID=A0A4P7UA87_9ACTN|nr:barstar family protein [Nocardioides daphniae]QCC77002.1 hypothetical protein E2C04_06850 [Nocardioides daphniae]GGD18560.1 hypothetical protein GCM10007231_17110 [Nocardioides daphniae]
MSGLAPLLARRHPAGVYRWEAAYDVDQVASVVHAAHWSFHHVDGVAAATKRELLAALGVALEFPATYGQNLDALADLLDDLAGPTLLLWDEWGLLAREDERTFATLLQIFSERADDAVRPPFAVLLRGAGPEVVGLGLLD